MDGINSGCSTGRKPTLLQEFPMDDARREDAYEMTSD